MEPQNDTQILELFLLGLSEDPELQSFIFALFLSMYLVTVLGNLLIILATISDSHLHTPMYFFLSNLSFVDICFTTTTVPKMLVNIQTQSKTIAYEGCIIQIYYFTLLVGLDNFLLTVMAYDRFVAICHPLHYMVIMKPQFCVLLVLASWAISSLNSLLQSLMVLRLSFCTDLEITHFFCEPNHSGQEQAFSTCASHISVVSLFYCTLLGVYLISAVTQNAHSSATALVMYSVVTPMMNPFIYSLRNKDIKSALKTLLGRETVKASEY
ncbi:Olfactory receptor 7A17 [Sciurus carolinensis]|uniref:Olfactory receptor 7A17 n=1 Tax=Sciurus carolinensis TaxID=30640 RepID=A0AA41SS37_SCICA|nr:Olfactory receptor 7A17 [Sciurus carolinensis]